MMGEMLVKRNKKILLLVIAVSLLIFGGCRREEQKSESMPRGIQDIMRACTHIEIMDITENSQTTTEANVRITMPDINKIYMDLLTKGNANTMTTEEIGASILEYADQEEFLITYNTTTSVTGASNEWTLSSDECIDALVRQQINALLVQMMNNLGSIEIEGDVR